VTGVLLVGGESRRFGSPKALARLGEETLAERAWRVLGEACDERLAVGKRADGLPLPFPLLDDGGERRAPLFGIAAGLRHARHETCVFLPVDMPAVTAPLLAALAAALTGSAELTRPAAEPFPTAIRRSALPVIEARIAGGELPVKLLPKMLETRLLEADERELANVNTPEDLRRLATPAG
jgi:molybdopterin-guanine dinucleotide biosynthesis protein A